MRKPAVLTFLVLAADLLLQLRFPRQEFQQRLQLTENERPKTLTPAPTSPIVVASQSFSGNFTKTRASDTTKRLGSVPLVIVAVSWSCKMTNQSPYLPDHKIMFWETASAVDLSRPSLSFRRQPHPSTGTSDTSDSWSSDEKVSWGFILCGPRRATWLDSPNSRPRAGSVTLLRIVG